MQVIGLGTQDSFGEAEDFTERHSLTIPMLWDESFESWSYYGITGQPAYALISAEGKVIERSFGAWPDDILDQLP